MPEFTPSDLARWCGGTWRGVAPPSLNAVSTDSRTIAPGALFVALRGENFDGHDYVGAAFARGAAAALVDVNFAGVGSSSGRAGGGHPLEGSEGPISAVAGRTDTPLLQVFDTRRALLDLARGHRAALPMRTIAITGSAGKTTVKEMTADILALSAATARTRGNWNNDVGLPLSLLAADRSQRFGVFEVGMNHPGELEPLCRAVRPNCSIITSIGPAHLEFFKDERGIAEEKATVFRALRKSGKAILCRDEKWFDVLRAAARCRVITTSLRGHADYVARLAPDGSPRFVVTEKKTGDRVEFTAPLPGAFIVHDALLAIAAARSFRLSWSKIQSAIANYRAAPMRWERVEAGGLVFINDCYNASPLSMKAAIEAFATMKVDGRRLAVLGGMKELGAAGCQHHEQVGQLIAQSGLAALVTVGEQGGWIADGAAAAGPAAAEGDGGGAEMRIHRARDVAEVVAYLRQHATPGDTVLLKASRLERLERIIDGWQKSG